MFIMDKVWEHHFKYYDLFQNNSERYRKTIDLHLKELKYFKKILDTGAGSGNLTFELLKQDKEVTAIDLDEFSLEILKQKCKEYKNKLKILKMDVQKLAFRNNEFGAVSSMFVIPFVKDNKKYFSEVYRVLRKGGKFTISAWAPVSDSWYGIMDLLEKELEQKGLLPKYQKEWEYIQESSKAHVKNVVKGPKVEELKLMLDESGFKNIRDYPKNPYNKYAYFITCEK